MEAIKILLVFFLAGYFAKRWPLLRELREKRSIVAECIPGIEIPRFEYAAAGAHRSGRGAALLLSAEGPRPGAGLRLRFLTLYCDCAQSRDAGGDRAGCAARRLSRPAIFSGTPKTVHDRVAMWLSPWSNTVRGGDQVAHSLWAMASGGALGTGPGLGESDVIPAGYTDLIVSVLGEDWGFLGIAVRLSDLWSADLAGTAHRPARAHRLRVSSWRSA